MYELIPFTIRRCICIRSGLGGIRKPTFGECNAHRYQGGISKGLYGGIREARNEPPPSMFGSLETG